MNKYKLNLDDIYGVCKCGCVMIKDEDEVYKPNQIINYKKILHNFNKNFWCCNGCQNGYYKDGNEHSWIKEGKID